jgi:hypothetical protein
MWVFGFNGHPAIPPPPISLLNQGYADLEADAWTEEVKSKLYHWLNTGKWRRMGNWIPFLAWELDGGWVYKFVLVPFICEEITSDTPALSGWVHLKSDLGILAKRKFYAINGNWLCLPALSHSLHWLIGLYSGSSPVCYYFKCSTNIIWLRK